MTRWTLWLCLAAGLSLLGLGCGSSGAGGATGVTVTVTPKTATVFVTGTQQFFANVTGGGQVATIASSNGAVRAANVVTITTTSPHGLSSGQTVTISGVSDSSFNGTFVIASVPSTTTFTYAQTGANATSGGGTVSTSAARWFVNSVEGGNTTFGTISTTGLYTAPGTAPATTFTIASNGAVRSSNVVTITTTAAHNLVVDQMVTISGVTDTSFNGTFTVASVPSSTTFTYAQTAANATSGGGTVTSTAVQVKAVAIADNTKSDTATVSIDSGVRVTVSPATATVGSGQVATIASSNGAVRAANVVTITTTSPHGLSSGQTVTISGVSDSSFNGTFVIATVPSTTTFTYAQTGANATSGGGTVATGENFPFNFMVTCPTSSCGGVTWSLNPATGFGTINANTGVYTAPGTVPPSPATATVTATSQVDTTKTASATVTIVMAADPTLTAINPTSAPQGSVFQDVYLTGTNFISTTQVFFNGIRVDTSRITAVSGMLLRVRLPDILLVTATPPAGAPVTVQRQSGMPTPAQNFAIVPVRPALVGASPDSGTQGGAAVTFNVNGGYYGPSGSATVTPVFDGGPKAATSNNPRQLSVVIGGAGTTDLTSPGLVSAGVRNRVTPSLVALTNFAVQPSAGSASVVGSPLVGMQPGAVAVNTATGIAVVANRGSDNLTLIDLGTLAVSGAPIPLGPGAAPTGVAVDNVRNLAVVANNGSNSVSVVNLAAAPPTVTPVTANIATRPFSVGVNPQTGLALVTYQPVAPAVGTNVASIIDLTSSPPSVVGAVTVSDGATPQVAVEPRLNWAVVTPGGTVGSLSIVDLGRRNSSAIAAPTGASCSANTATITTTAPHGLTTIPVPSAVLITGVAVSAFNGYFTVASVPSSTTFTYTLTCATPLSSGGGTAFYSNPLATVTLGTDVTGIAINPETEKAMLADPTTNTLTFFSVLDQTVTNLTLPDVCPSSLVCAFAAAVNPLTNTGVSVNRTRGEATVIDPRTPGTLGAPIAVGSNPKAVAIDPGSNLAVIANEGSNTVSILSLGAVSGPGAIRPLHVTQLVLPPSRQFSASNPTATLTSTTDLPLTIVGKGFVSGSRVRLDGALLAAPSSVTDRQMNVVVPAATFLASARRYAVDVLNPSGALSNVTDLTVIQPVSVASAGCAVPAPRAVAIDPERNLAVVANTGTGCNNISLIDLNAGAVSNTLAVGKNPQGVAVISRLGRAVVTNRDDGTASLVDLVAKSVNPTAVTVGTQPIGVAINQDTAQAVVANSGSNTVSLFSTDTGTTTPTVTTVSVDQRPVAVAIDSIRNLALVANAGPNSNNLNQIDLSQATPTVGARYPCQQNPTGVVFDPASNLFVAACALNNSLVLVDPAAQQSGSLRVGINPTSLANNFLSSTLVTVNTASNTMTVVDFLDRRMRAILGMTGSQQFSIDIHPRTNLAVIADENNNRVLLVPLPR